MNAAGLLVPMAATPGYAHELLLPGEVSREAWIYPAPDPALLTVDEAMMQGLAARALAVGDGGLTTVGVAALNHGDGATTVARSLAICLTATFGKRVVLVEGNQRSPCLRRIYRLPDGPGLADVMARRISLGGALQAAVEHRRILVLPASSTPEPGLGAEAMRGVLAALLGYADAVVVDLAPVIPYRDTGLLCAALDGVALVLRGGRSSVVEGRAAVQCIRSSGTPVLGAVLNRERPAVPRFLERMFRRGGG